jgi:hypothetical protein
VISRRAPLQALASAPRTVIYSIHAHGAPMSSLTIRKIDPAMKRGCGTEATPAGHISGDQGRFTSGAFTRAVGSAACLEGTARKGGSGPRRLRGVGS